MTPEPSPSLRLLAHPYFTGAVAVLAVNDHVAALATSATSCDIPRHIDIFVVDGSRVYAHIAGDADLHPGPRWATSDDGGQSWRRSTAPALPWNASACSATLGCFRGRDKRIEGSHAGEPWTEAFAFTAEQRERMRLRTDYSCGRRTGFGRVAVVSGSDGDHVIVAMGTQGILHRSPSGRWTRQSVLGLDPVSLAGPSWLVRLDLVPLALGVVAPVLLVIGRRRRGRERALTSFAIALGGGVGLLAVGGFSFLMGVDYAVAGPGIAGLSVLVFFASVIITLVPVRGRETS